jgi:hypothetical protein
VQAWSFIQTWSKIELMSKLDRNLRALAICYSILGGLVGLILALTMLVSGIAILGSGSFPLVEIAFLLLLLLAGGTAALFVFDVASSLRKHESRTFCLVMAWLTCAFFPLGTVLGVLTIVQLIQPEAERAFQEAERPDAKMEGFQNHEGSPASE